MNDNFRFEELLPGSTEYSPNAPVQFVWNGTGWRVRCDGKEITGDLAKALISSAIRFGLKQPSPEFKPKPKSKSEPEKESDYDLER
jgi:hypothetical protein